MELFKTFSAAAATLAFTLISSAEADAHAHLLSAVPAMDKMAMPPPQELILKFSEEINIQGTSIEIIGPDKKPVEIISQVVDPKSAKTLKVELKAPLGDGKYQVHWKALSADGDGSSGSYVIDSME